MEERITISLLLDIYGNLLTDKQQEIMHLYFNEDLSLAEISEISSTSRQAVHDIIKRCHKLLLEYECHLNLLEKETKLREVKNSIIEKLELLKSDTQESEKLQWIEEIKARVMNEF